MKCPKCGSEHVQFATSTKGGGFSFFDSCCGYILLGPLGLLCGALGSGTHTDEFWVCHDCGYKFSRAAGQRNIEQTKTNEQKAAKNYAQYKAELAALENTEGDYDQICQRHQEAIQRQENADCQYKKILTDAKSSNDVQIQKLAKSVDNTTRLYRAIAGLILLGVIFLFLAFPLGATLLIVGIILWIVQVRHEKKCKEKLGDLLPDFKIAADELNHAKSQLKKLQDLVEKINFVKAYESQHMY